MTSNKRTVIATDFDGTLTTRDTLMEFFVYVNGRGRTILGFLLNSPFLILMILHLYSNHKAKERMFRWFFRGMRLEEFDRLCGSFARESRHILRKGGLEMIDKALAEGAEVAVISASIRNWVQPFFPTLKALCTEVEVDGGGRLTGRFLTGNCFGKEKVSRLLEAFPDRESYRLVAYGDSRGDKELLDFADESHFKPFRED